METRASHLYVGTLVLLFVLATLGFVLWLVRADVNKERAYYDIYFEGSVAGLGLGGDVFYRGIRVGAVDKLTVPPDNPTKVRVKVELDADFPIRQGDQASLELQLITGLAYIDIDGAGPNSPLLEARPGQKRPVIPSKPSAVALLFKGAPALINQGILLSERIESFLTEENAAAVSGILADFHVLSSEMAGRQEQLGRTLDSFEKGSRELSEVSAIVRSTLSDVESWMSQANETLAVAHNAMVAADELITNDAKGMITDFRQTAVALSSAAGQLESLVAENREPVSAFTQEGLTEIVRLTGEARFLMERLARLLERLDTEGAGFLLGTQDQEFEADP